MIDARHGDCLDVLPSLAECSVDAVVTDPPYGLEFMGKEWDSLRWNGQPHGADNRRPTDENGRSTGLSRMRVPRPRYGSCGADMQQWHGQWAVAALRALKPGGYLLAFGGTRTFHRLACAVEDAGFEVRDCLCWLYGQGFPKGRGCLKPGWEPIVLARKPGPRVLPLNVDGARLEDQARTTHADGNRRTASSANGNVQMRMAPHALKAPPAGRWPPNVCLDEEAAAQLDEMSGVTRSGIKSRGSFPSELGLASNQGVNKYHREGRKDRDEMIGFRDSGGASRFFYCAKASRSERGAANTHPTVKPLALMQWLVRVVSFPGETVLDPFLGSGTTAVACLREGRSCIGIEKETAYVEIIRRRIEAERAKCPLFTEAK